MKWEAIIVSRMKKLLVGLLLMVAVGCKAHEPCQCNCQKPVTVKMAACTTCGVRVADWAGLSKAVVTHNLYSSPDTVTNHYCVSHAPKYDAIRDRLYEKEYLVADKNGPDGAWRRVNEDGSEYKVKKCADCGNKHACEPIAVWWNSTTIYLTNRLR